MNSLQIMLSIVAVQLCWAITFLVIIRQARTKGGNLYDAYLQECQKQKTSVKGIVPFRIIYRTYYNLSGWSPVLLLHVFSFGLGVAFLFAMLVSKQ